ncbi:hypothetical protein DFR78_1474 [Halanaerobium sp. MA284_MarDTE_T2]|nr:hypothetical protein DFR78_1474 [Halanaerobium sp. MA284_MarDTE_T2]RCW78889.1 hypothetical protein DER71_1464 [Halanaerobium sp. DL-01]
MNKTKLSKTVSYILRHHPEDFNLKPAADYLSVLKMNN